MTLTGSVKVISQNTPMVLIAGNAVIKNIVMEGWQRMTLSDVVIPQKVNDIAGGNVRYLA